MSITREDMLALYAKYISKLRRIIALAEKLIEESPKPRRGRPTLSNGRSSSKEKTNGKRIRRTGKDLMQFRKMLKAERKKGIPVADIARRHSISSTYIYLLR